MSTSDSDTYLLPLFPLETILFPDCLLQLHVFEERYKTMINRCIEESTPFGVVLIREGTEVGPPALPFDVGCKARIVAVKRLDEGRIHLLAVGEERFRIVDYLKTDLPYQIGRVVALEDEPAECGIDGTSTDTTDAQALSGLFQQYLSLLEESASVEIPAIDLPDEPTPLSFFVASVLQLDAIEKQRLIETTDVCARMRWEIAAIHEQIEELKALRAGAKEPPKLRVRRIDFKDGYWQAYRHQSRN